MNKFGAFAAAAVMVAFAGSAKASLIGDEVTVQYMSPNQNSVVASDVVTVGAGSEIVCPASNNLCSLFLFELDFVADSVTFRSDIAGQLITQPFNGFGFLDLDFSASEVIASLALDTNIAGLDLGRINYGDDFAYVNLSGLQLTTDSFFSLNFTTRDVTAVSEPGGLGLVGLGLIGLGLGLRRRQSI